MRSPHLVDPETLAALDEAPELGFSDETLAIQLGVWTTPGHEFLVRTDFDHVRPVEDRQ